MIVLWPIYVFFQNSSKLLGEGETSEEHLKEHLESIGILPNAE